MVSRKFGFLGLGLALGLSTVGCVHEAQTPEPYAALPVLVSGADAASFTVRVDDNFTLTGRESEEVADRANWKTKLPAAFQEKLEAAGFKVVPATERADLVLTVQSKDLEWTGHFWEARGHVDVSLSRPSAPNPDAAPPADPNANPYLVVKTVAGFDHLDFPESAGMVATMTADQLARSPELAQWIKEKRAKDGAAPPAPAPPPPPPPASP